MNLSGSELLNRIPNIDLVIRVALAVAVAWLLIEIFVWWRRRVTNLTVTATAPRDRHADPDFLRVDRQKRTAAIKRGDAYDKELTRLERAENQATQHPVESKLFTSLGTILGCLAVIVATAAVLLVVGGCLWPDSFAGRLMQDYDSEGRLAEIIHSNILTIGATIAINVVFLVRMLYSTKDKVAVHF